MDEDTKRQLTSNQGNPYKAKAPRDEKKEKEQLSKIEDEVQKDIIEGHTKAYYKKKSENK